MPHRHAIDLINDEILIYFPYNRENNRALREYTQPINLHWDRSRRAYCLDAAEADSPEVCDILRGFASRRGLRFNRAAAARLGAFVTRSTGERIRAEIRAIDHLLTVQTMPNPAADGQDELHDRLHARRRALTAILTWPAFPRRPEGCDIASPGCLFHLRYDDGEEETRVLAVTEIEGYDNIPPHRPLGKTLGTARIGDRIPLGRGRASFTVLDITD
ncbi:hypothetical protein SAMN04489712_10664 [Thermomonospora echinospora]|uniref:Uncharacterized protein n=1 Tax=Thermomonospora echinospora TaxID=1992 RepID=A0A1H6AXZ4_9ACTN|nr:hypothetical protein [Thermomonospora echinospora]SEG52955.1 hypothetical protein SAMN04489712_10664 [Thermomonospora echinospora]